MEIGPDIPFRFQANTKNAPYAWGNFHACAIIRLTATPGPGAASVLVDRHVTWQRAEPDLSDQRCCKLRLKPRLVDKLAKKT